ncbi:gamma-glutamyl-gamma-aminobutyrate hydrolase family protein [Sulfobacillus thermosulfidooxidans]|uniref:Putative glutamine amidotransferase n=1 Tax=Sulfobacillus thermosulfidooxidans (strain DSM 9293 / VKM B-1269 / AT-1) TaxID=929705 RepID=A0A1W1WGJ2_SULTA|nr:gamma-glutamyl-gamma-aminobutyrate hydrolase family protein [Sulfobacillus thermosulfidooxidans]OLZ10005.1 peptidase C26 [Sulfobacillus thermosulfidooxidans]OLZ15690.1 peptidase C26 [Sulfobacillus thermosulfidooxidans]OLZ18464.1 peptidase C26 [Sulfobacillus thermosulfidooxidans]SMC05421.1 putative glutamine amidotransferase [Sulfobacillus thermosulfidooxidans DSM 9293]
MSTPQLTKPLIGISVSREIGSDNVPRDFLRATYLHAIQLAGGIPILLPNIPESQEALKVCHGLLLTGGGDYDPARYGQSDKGTKWDGVSTDRDETELLLIRTAYDLAMPIFGICRGIQALAVAGDGSLIQDIPTTYPDSVLHHHQSAPRSSPTHQVTVDKSSHLASILGTEQVVVNSFHHQAVDQVPKNWVVNAHAEDGVIEGMELPQYPFGIGVQWHPEDLVDSFQEARQLFIAFVQAARQYQEANY